MNNKEYWNKRAEQRILMGEKTADELLQSMKVVYKNSLADINKEIEAFYGRYAKDGNISIAELHKRLDSKELKSAKEELKRYYDTVDKLVRDADGKVDTQLLKQHQEELRLLSAKSYMSRLEELKLNLKKITVNLGTKESKAYYQTLERIYKSNYTRVNYEMDKFFGWSDGFQGLNYKKLNSAIHQKWLGRNFSERIWENKGKLLDQINTTFLQGVAQGHSVQKISEKISKNMGTSYSNCERLVRTESAHIMGEATLQGYKDRGTERYKFIATLDNRTSDICQNLDGQVFDLKDAEEGINYPPMHPNCRSTTIPYFEPDDISKKFEESQRAARDENGKIYYVPALMNYKDWQQTMQKEPNMTPKQVIAIVTPIVQKKETELKTKDEFDPFANLIDDEKSVLREKMEEDKVESIDIKALPKPLTSAEIAARLHGGDKTEGSCLSLACAYAANKAGFDVLDFRGGKSCDILASYGNWQLLMTFKGVKSTEVKSGRGVSELESALKVVQNMKKEKEYILITGLHAAVVTLKNNIPHYLELQDPAGTYYNPVNEMSLRTRFRCKEAPNITRIEDIFTANSHLIEIESLGRSKEFIEVMKYINTNSDKQQKGSNGGMK